MSLCLILLHDHSLVVWIVIAETIQAHVSPIVRFADIGEVFLELLYTLACKGNWMRILDRDVVKEDNVQAVIS